MGIDHIMVDESQQFKNLAYMTTTNVAGLSKAEGSRRAFNLLVGMRYLQDVLAQTKAQPLSGTPISNSMVEMYSFIKIHASKQNERIRFYYFLTNGPQPLQVQQTR
jgi:N12 class adenine-specific DNA methylase